MQDTFAANTVEALCAYVRSVLCERDQLDPEQTPLLRSLITRGKNRSCGLFFQVQGPRMVRSYAVWAGDESRLLFYDSHGKRFGQTRLSEAPDPAQLS
jgi:hypothetical protein